MSGQFNSFTPAGLPAEEKATLKSYGGWTNFTQSYGLKPYDAGDHIEGQSILRSFGDADRKEAAAAKAGGAGGAGQGTAGQGGNGQSGNGQNGQSGSLSQAR